MWGHSVTTSHQKTVHPLHKSVLSHVLPELIMQFGVRYNLLTSLTSVLCPWAKDKSIVRFLS